ncbi:MAG: ABC transporter ATP-binding protein [Tissierellia bacterium]|nr:ABC transporter ATP-binding protein [Tissierellia bacterium]
MILDIKNLSYYYGDKEVLHNISFGVEEGDFISIIGPNGSGKTSLMKAILGVSSGKRKGSILLNNILIENYSYKELAKNIAAVFQTNSLEFDFTVEEIIEMGRFPYLKRFESIAKRDKEIINKVMKYVGITEFANRSYKKLSGGEFQRVMIGRALSQEAKILILDEPVNHLDLKYQIAILNLLKNLNEEDNITIIVILHDLNLASLYSDKIILLKDGRVENIGDAKSVLTLENIESLYETNVYINNYPDSMQPYIIPKI